MEDLTRRHNPLPPKEGPKTDEVWVICNGDGKLHSIWPTELEALRRANGMTGYTAQLVKFGTVITDKGYSTNYFDR